MKTSSLQSLLATGDHPPAQSPPVHYFGLYEASAAAPLDERAFVVASDENNTLQVYQRGRVYPVGAVRLKDFIGHRKSDIEAAARIGDIIYWITSHSRPEGGKGGTRKRSALFATRVGSRNGTSRLKGVGEPFRKLRKSLRIAAGIDTTDLNIEGLAATPQGDLLIGFRSPLAENGNALVLPLENPAAVTRKGRAPRFGSLRELDLGGLGIRGIDRIGMPQAAYLLLAGPTSDAGNAFALYSWMGGDDVPVKIQDLDIKDFTAEALLTYPDSRTIQVLSDDGSSTQDDGDMTPKHQRRFRSIEITY